MAFLAAVCAVPLALLFIWMRFVEPYRYQISKHQGKIRKNLPRELRVLHLSDIHFSKPDARLSAFFDRLAREPCDFVFITGDIIDCIEGVPACAENLAKLKPAHGIFAVYGNHDYYNYHLSELILHNFPGQRFPKNHQHVHLLDAALRDIGVRVLKNETVEIDWHGVPLLIHGLDDPTSRRANLRKAMQHFDREKVNVLLTHTIDAFIEIGRNEIDLAFSGHSHGGQICLPFWGPLLTHTIMGRKFASGFLSHKGALCSVSRGIGTSRFAPVRLLCLPEALLISYATLDSRGSSGGHVN
ncbi:MAG TPA: metallophosphoesterase [Verrucomicrobiae bacterium]|nr:metallophosphoesterase [Verrucomicrobiae bacterium]